MWNRDQVRPWAPLFLGLLLLAAPASAVEKPRCDLTVAEEVRAVAIVNGTTFDTADGRRVRLSALQAPTTSPFGTHAKDRLTALLAGKAVGLAFADSGADRHGRLLAHVFVDGEWIQSALIAEGLARVATRLDMRRCSPALLADEAAARAAKRGLWNDPAYAVRSPNNLDADIGTFQIVEGRVMSAKVGRDRTYLNFGPDYRTDFTATIARRDAMRMAKEGASPETYQGKTIRVRGWLTRLNGPELEVTHREQIELPE
ncbi:MAG: thermonuclease family protein [Alphaproteobacteria bacterium]|nr:thermonuclease family protein [Alphaproteobacteria bacterium]